VAQRFYYFIVVLILSAASTDATAQSTRQQIPVSLLSSRSELHTTNGISPQFVMSAGKPSIGSGRFQLPQSLYVSKLEFFCRKEYQFEKATSLPLRFRLGSLEHTDRLELKSSARHIR
jgi:hypothetical protein